jgi:hypothetical protein
MASLRPWLPLSESGVVGRGDQPCGGGRLNLVLTSSLNEVQYCMYVCMYKVCMKVRGLPRSVGCGGSSSRTGISPGHDAERVETASRLTHEPVSRPARNLVFSSHRPPPTASRGPIGDGIPSKPSKMEFKLIERHVAGRGPTPMTRWRTRAQINVCCSYSSYSIYHFWRTMSRDSFHGALVTGRRVSRQKGQAGPQVRAFTSPTFMKLRSNIFIIRWPQQTKLSDQTRRSHFSFTARRARPQHTTHSCSTRYRPISGHVSESPCLHSPIVFQIRPSCPATVVLTLCVVEDRATDPESIYRLSSLGPSSARQSLKWPYPFLRDRSPLPPLPVAFIILVPLLRDPPPGQAASTRPPRQRRPPLSSSSARTSIFTRHHPFPQILPPPILPPHLMPPTPLCHPPRRPLQPRIRIPGIPSPSTRPRLAPEVRREGGESEPGRDGRQMACSPRCGCVTERRRRGGEGREVHMAGVEEDEKNKSHA